MAEQAIKRQLALDSNILFDLANGRDFAHTFREVFQSRGYSLKVSPTVIQELSFQAFVKNNADSPIALKALSEMRNWGIIPFDLAPTGHAITEHFSDVLIKKGFLPEGEKHDGFILAEASLAYIPVVATRDDHLLGIDITALRAQFENLDLFPVSPAHPATLLRAFK